MKEVEVQVRHRARLSDSLVGTKLIPFRPPKTPGGDAGPLWREELDAGESVAQMDLFKGAIGLFKNPWAAVNKPVPSLVDRGGHPIKESSHWGNGSGTRISVETDELNSADPDASRRGTPATERGLPK